jgi:hypothetical protein
MTRLVLPRPSLSYSSLSLWSRDRDKFRRRYYEGIKEPETVYTLFGKEIHKQIEKDDKYKQFRLPVAEQKMEAEVKGIKIVGYLDTYDPATHFFGDFKTGIAKPDGSPRWTQVEVEKTEQLPFYSFLIQENHSFQAKNCFLVWLETQFRDNDKTFGGVKLGGERELELTGRYEVFERKIYQKDRDWIAKWIVNLAKEISNDYQKWLKSTKK